MQFYEAARNLRATLDAGITSVRDAGGADLGIKEAVERGMIPGPRMQISLIMLSQTGGHGDGWLASGADSEFFVAHPGRPSDIVDGPDEMRRKVRELIRAGADVIKVATSGGVLSPRDDPAHAHFALDELRGAGGRGGCGRQVGDGPCPGHRRHQERHPGGDPVDRARHLPRRRGHRDDAGPRDLPGPDPGGAHRRDPGSRGGRPDPRGDPREGQGGGGGAPRLVPPGGRRRGQGGDGHRQRRHPPRREPARVGVDGRRAGWLPPTCWRPPPWWPPS